MQQCYPVICAWVADYFEIIHLLSIKHPHCPVCKASILGFGEANSSSYQLWDYGLYFEKMLLATQGDESDRRATRQYLEHHVVGTSEGMICFTKCISQMTIVVPDIVHTVYLHMLKHLMDWVTFFLEQHCKIDKFNLLWVMMPSYPGFARFNKPHGQVTQKSGTEMKPPRRVIVSVPVAILFNPPASERISFTDVLLCIKNLVYFHLLAQYWYYMEAMIK